jgi:phosphoglycerate kinase
MKIKKGIHIPHTLDTVNVKGKTVLIRLDLNSPYDAKKKKILNNERIRASVLTLKELSRKKAKTVILAHQGRKGDEDFTHLNQHALLLGRELGKKIKYVDDVIGQKAKDAIHGLKPGEILLLDNVRMIDDEEDEHKALAGHSSLVKALMPFVTIFVNDAFSASHRAHASVVGFARMKCYFGRLMQDELESIEKALESPGINTYILGGAKSDDCVNITDHILKKNPDEMEFALTCGVTANLFLKAAGVRIGKGSEDLLAKKDLLKYVDCFLKTSPSSRRRSASKSTLTAYPRTRQFLI